MQLDDLTIGEAKKLAKLLRDCGDSHTESCGPRERTPVLVCTDKRGVIFGDTEDPSARPLTLTNARMALYWSADVGGVFGLAERGPTSGCKISATAPTVTLEGVTAVFSVDPKAVKAWLDAPVQGR